MSGIATSEANSILDAQLTGSLYLAMYTTAPTAGSAGTEVTGGSYARQAISFSAASGGIKTQSGAINFPTASAGWGNLVGWAVMSASSGGTRKAFKAFSSIPINNGDQLSVPASTISVSLS